MMGLTILVWDPADWQRVGHKLALWISIIKNNKDNFPPFLANISNYGIINMFSCHSSTKLISIHTSSNEHQNLKFGKCQMILTYQSWSHNNYLSIWNQFMMLQFFFNKANGDDFSFQQYKIKGMLKGRKIVVEILSLDSPMCQLRPMFIE